MNRKKKRARNKAQNRQLLEHLSQFDQQPKTFEPAASYIKHKKAPSLEAQTHAQGLYISTILHSDITFGIGPAGTGKTYVCAALACEALEQKKIEKIIITRPAVEAEETLGFIPGELDDKYAPYLQPFLDVFYQRLGKGKTEYLMRMKVIEARPLGFMRGSTFSNAWVILDEAQNTTVPQMKMFLTRIGHNCKMIANGDIEQSDLGNRVSGLKDAMGRFDGMPEIGITEFTEEDCVRHGITRKILSRYKN